MSAKGQQFIAQYVKSDCCCDLDMAWMVIIAAI